MRARPASAKRFVPAQSLGPRETNPALVASGQAFSGLGRPIAPRDAFLSKTPSSAAPTGDAAPSARSEIMAPAEARARAYYALCDDVLRQMGDPRFPWRSSRDDAEPASEVPPADAAAATADAAPAALAGEVEDPELWSAARVAEWVAALPPPLDRHAPALFANGVDGAALRRLGASELPTLGVREWAEVRAFTARSRELFGMATPRTHVATAPPPSAVPAPPPPAARDAFDIARLRSVTAKVKEMDDAAEPARVSIHELLGEGAGALGGARVAQLLKERAAAEGG